MKPERVLSRAVFAVDEDERTWADVVHAAQAWGDWDVVERAVTTPAPAAVTPAAVRGAVEERSTMFRYQRNLLSVDETEDWFEHWGVPLAEWLAHLRRQVVGEGGSDRELAVWIEAVTSGALERAARRLAAALAVHRRVGGTGRPDVAELEAAMAEFADRVASRDRVVAIITERRLAWRMFDLQVVDLIDEGTARELLYCVREDGRALGEVAREAGARVEVARLTLEEAPSELRPVLAGSVAGDLLGPLLVDGTWRIVAVTGRAEPTQDDPQIASRARDLLVERAIIKEVSRRVRWLDPVAASTS